MRSPAVIVPVGGCAVLLAACGGIPSSGGPFPAAEVDSEEAYPQVVRDLQPAADDMSANEIVDGFLDAMEIYEPPGGYPTAATFLTDEAQAGWEEPLSEIVIYDGGATTEIELDGDTGEATLALDVEATYDRVNGFVRSPEDAEPTTYNFPLERIGGQWRLAQAPKGLLIETESFDRYFSPHNLYFFNAGFDGNTLVPDPVYLPTTANQQTLLVQELLNGPSDWLAPAVQTAFPAGTSLEPAAVPVSGGDATVTLSPEAVTAADGTAIRPDTRAQMVTQLRATLGELRGVRRVQVVAGTTRLSGTEEAPYVDVEASSGATGLASRLYTVTESGVSWVADGASPVATPVSGPLGSRSDVREVAVDRNHSTAAAVTTDNELITSDLAANGEITSLFEGSVAFDSLAWDGGGLLWAVERLQAESDAQDPDDGAEGGGDGSGGPGDSADAAKADEEAKGDSGNRLLVIEPETGDYEDVTPQTPGGAEIEQFAIAPDGARLALVIDGSAYLAIVERDPASADQDPDMPQDPSAVSIGGLRELHLDDLSMPLSGVAWYDSDELALLTAPETQSAEEVSPESGEAQKPEPPAPTVRLARLDELVAEEDGRPIPNGTSIAAPTVDDRLAVGTSENEVWIRFELGRWIALEGATAPAYAG